MLSKCFAVSPIQPNNCSQHCYNKQVDFAWQHDHDMSCSHNGFLTVSGSFTSRHSQQNILLMKSHLVSMASPGPSPGRQTRHRQAAPKDTALSAKHTRFEFTLHGPQQLFALQPRADPQGPVTGQRRCGGRVVQHGGPSVDARTHRHSAPQVSVTRARMCNTVKHHAETSGGTATHYCPHMLVACLVCLTTLQENLDVTTWRKLWKLTKRCRASWYKFTSVGSHTRCARC
jgi:hypothetical protein